MCLLSHSVSVIKSNCNILQFLHKMFNVSALLLDDALLKYVGTEVVLFSIVAVKTLTFHKIVQRHTLGVMVSLVTVLLQNVILILAVKKCLKIGQYLTKLVSNSI